MNILGTLGCTLFGAQVLRYDTSGPSIKASALEHIEAEYRTSTNASVCS